MGEGFFVMNILYFVADGINEYNSSRWRVSTPYNAINGRNWEHKARIASAQDWLKQSEEAIKLCQWADLISIQRVAIATSLESVRHWRSQGKAVIIDYDDDYFRINKSNAAYKFWGKGNVDITSADGLKFESPMETHPVYQFIEGLKACTAATMPSSLLAKDAREYTPAYLVPNFFEKRLYPEQNKRPYDENRIVIGWGGSLSHLESFEHSGVIPALKNILAERENVYLLIVGDERVTKKLKELGLREDRLLHHPYVSYDRWYKTLQLYDIGIAPLAMEYDMRRSWIKVAEYMIMGIPFVATNGEPYFYEEIGNPVSGLFVSQGDSDKSDKPNQVDWEKCLKATIDNLEPLKESAQENSDTFFKVFDIENNVESMIEVYQEIIDLEKEKF